MNTARLKLVSMPSMPAGVALGLALLVIFAVYAETARSIVAIWNSSETFAHGYVILPISLWLIWRRRQELARIPARPFWPALLLLALCGFGWLLADLGGVQVVRQYAFVAMLPLMVLLIAGVEATAAMAFPLFFLLLAVPFGEAFVGPLINFTADFTVAALQLTGIPVLRNGSNFEIPSGSWSVVEACSGVRYLISSITLGCLYAYLNYRSNLRRLMFVLLSIAVPILANGLRAYLIVMIGHLSGNKLATGVDHLIYGWVFFGVVMFLMFWIGGFWRESPQPTARSEPVASRLPSAPGTTLGAAAAAGIAVLVAWPLYADYLDRATHRTQPIRLDGFHAQWQAASPFTEWQPGFTPASAELRRFFRHDAQQVGLSARYYRNQREGATLISSSNRLVHEKEKRWLHVASSVRSEHIGGREITMREGRIQGASGPFLVWSWYWIGGRFVASDYVGKLLQAQDKLQMRGDDGAVLMVFAPYASNPEEAREAMRAFLSQHMTQLETMLASNRT